MRYDNLPSFEKYLESTAPKELGTLYFIIGKDSSEDQNAIDLLLNFLLPANEMREFALITFDGAQVDEGVLINALDSGSFFVKSQIIWIQNIDKSKKSIQDILEKLISRPHGSQSLVLSATSWLKNSSFYKTIEKAGIILDLVELKPWEKEKKLVAWIDKQAAAARKQMSYQACQLFVKRIGHDQALLMQELEKLICYCIDKKEITERDVEAICSSEHSHTIWQLGEAIFCRDSATALRMGSVFLNEGQSFLPLLRQIRFQFQTEYQVCLLLAQGKEPQEITQQFPYMKGQILERHIQQAQKYGLRAFKTGLLAIDQAEMRAKNSSVDEKILLELLMMQLTRRI